MTNLAPYRELATSPRLWQQVKALRGLLRIEAEVAIPALKARENMVIWGEKINDLSPLPPERHFRDAMMDGAKQFVAQMGRLRERYHLVTNEADLMIYGPGVDRGFGRSETDGMKVMATQEDEVKWPETFCFFIVGDFVAEFGHLVPHDSDEERHQIRVTSVAEWEAAEKAAERQLLEQQRRR